MRRRPSNACLAVVASLLLLVTSCNRDRPAPVKTLPSGAYQIALQARGGILKSGRNDIAVALLQDGQPAEASSGYVVFWMPWLGRTQHIDTYAPLSPVARSA